MHAHKVCILLHSHWLALHSFIFTWNSISEANLHPQNPFSLEPTAKGRKRKASDAGVDSHGRGKVLKKSPARIFPIVSLLDGAFDVLDREVTELAHKEGELSTEKEQGVTLKDKGQVEVLLPTPATDPITGLVSLQNVDFVFPWSTEVSVYASVARNGCAPNFAPRKIGSKSKL